MLQPNAFIGTWTLARRLTDRLGQMDGAFTGQAVWRRQDDGSLDYAENGTLVLDRGGEMHAERRYQWRWEGDEVAVYFADGAPFHRFEPTGRGAGTTHLCGADTYNVAYDFTDWPAWTATWDVVGPRKDYTSHSTYRPAIVGVNTLQAQQR